MYQALIDRAALGLAMFFFCTVSIAMASEPDENNPEVLAQLYEAASGQATDANSVVNSTCSELRRLRAKYDYVTEPANCPGLSVAIWRKRAAWNAYVIARNNVIVINRRIQFLNREQTRFDEGHFDSAGERGDVVSVLSNQKRKLVSVLAELNRLNRYLERNDYWTDPGRAGLAPKGYNYILSRKLQIRTEFFPNSSPSQRMVPLFEARIQLFASEIDRLNPVFNKPASGNVSNQVATLVVSRLSFLLAVAATDRQALLIERAAKLAEWQARKQEVVALKASCGVNLPDLDAIPDFCPAELVP